MIHGSSPYIDTEFGTIDVRESPLLYYQNSRMSYDKPWILRNSEKRL
jgi:hypothetical protein